MDIEEKRILRSIRNILQNDPYIRKKLLKRTSIKAIKTKWDLYSLLQEQSRYLLEEIETERRAEQRRILHESFIIRAGITPRPPLTATQAELENIIRTVTRMSRNRGLYTAFVKDIPIRGSLYGLFEQGMKEIARSGKNREIKGR